MDSCPNWNMYCTQVTDRKQFKEPKSCQKRDKFCIQRNSLLCSIAAKSQFVEPNVPVLASAGSQKKAAIAMEQEGAACGVIAVHRPGFWAVVRCCRCWNIHSCSSWKWPVPITPNCSLQNSGSPKALGGFDQKLSLASCEGKAIWEGPCYFYCWSSSSYSQATLLVPKRMWATLKRRQKQVKRVKRRRRRKTVAFPPPVAAMRDARMCRSVR